MVNSLAAAIGAGSTLAAAVEQQTLLERLDPVSRTKVIMALLGIVLVGVGLVAFTILAGRRVLRIARNSHGPTAHHDDAWFRKPLVPGEDHRSREDNTPAGPRPPESD